MDKLPKELLLMIFKYFNFTDFIKIVRCNRQFYSMKNEIALPITCNYLTYLHARCSNYFVDRVTCEEINSIPPTGKDGSKFIFYSDIIFLQCSDIAIIQSNLCYLKKLKYLSFTGKAIDFATLPSSIKHLCLPKYENTITSIPSTIIHLSINDYGLVEHNNDNNITSLTVIKEPQMYPPRLTNLLIIRKDGAGFVLNNLPDTLKTFTFMTATIDAKKLPKSIKILEVGSLENFEEGDLPNLKKNNYP